MSISHNCCKSNQKVFLSTIKKVYLFNESETDSKGVNVVLVSVITITPTRQKDCKNYVMAICLELRYSPFFCIYG